MAKKQRTLKQEVIAADSKTIQVIKERVPLEDIIDFLIGVLMNPSSFRSDFFTNCINTIINNIQSLCGSIRSVKIKSIISSDEELSDNQEKALRDIFIKSTSESSNDAAEIRHALCMLISHATLNSYSDFLLILEETKEGLKPEYFNNFVDNIYSTDVVFQEAIHKHLDLICNLFKMNDYQKGKLKHITHLCSLQPKLEKLLNLEKENTQLCEKINLFNEEKKVLNDQIKELKKSIRVLEKSKSVDQEYINQVETLRLRNENLMSDLEEYNQKINSLENEKNNLYIKCEELEKNVSNRQPIFRKSKSGPQNENSFIKSVKNNLALKGLCYDSDDIYNFHISLKASPLVILAGTSGVGKTRLPLAYAECINAREEDGTLLFLPISPSFTEPSDVLGFYNAVTQCYQPAGTGFVDFLKHSNENSDKMHMVIFDEMNLSQIEYWFAPFMSILEKPLDDRYLTLYSQEFKNNDSIYPPKLHIGENIIFVGTVNLDETTKDMSDRLIDRSIVINLKKQKFIDFYNQKLPEVEILTMCETADKFFSMKKEFPENYIKVLTAREVDFLDALHNMLQKYNSAKGVSFRNVYKISSYLIQSPNNSDFKRGLAFDLIFKQTILKKLNGYDASISKILGKLDDDSEIIDGLLIQILDEYSDISDFLNTRDEIKNKIKELGNYGFTR